MEAEYETNYCCERFDFNLDRHVAAANNRPMAKLDTDVLQRNAGTTSLTDKILVGESSDPSSDLELEVTQVLASMGTANIEEHTLFASPEVRTGGDNRITALPRVKESCI